MSAPGRPKRELRGLREVVADMLRRGVGRHPRSQARPRALASPFSNGRLSEGRREAPRVPQ